MPRKIETAPRKSPKHVPPKSPELVRAATYESLRKALAQLTPREEKILRMRFGISCHEHTYDQIAHWFSLKREEIQAIEKIAQQKLRNLFAEAIPPPYLTSIPNGP